MILIHLAADGEDFGDFNLMNSSKRSKTLKKYREIDNHFKRRSWSIGLSIRNSEFWFHIESNKQVSKKSQGSR